MWWPFISNNDPTAALSFTRTFAFHQQLYPAGQDRDFAFLAGDDVRQIVNGAHEVGDLFFEFLHMCLLSDMWTFALRLTRLMCALPPQAA